MPKVTFASDDKSFDVPEGTRIIDMCNDHDLSLPFGCRDGICGTCIMNVVEGSLAPPSEHEADTLERLDCKPNQRLGCQSKVKGDVTVENAE